MADLVFFDSFRADVFNGVHNLATDGVYVVLTNTAPTAATDEDLIDITQIAATGGYVTDGFALDSVTSTKTAGTYTLGANDEVITASGATMPDWRYAVLNNNTVDKLIGYYDRGSTVSLADGESITIDFTPAGVVFTMADAA
jgi:hypothetical protein